MVHVYLCCVDFIPVTMEINEEYNWILLHVEDYRSLSDTGKQ